MQSTNNRFKKIVLLGIFFIIVLIMIFFMIFVPQKNKKDDSNGEYYDPGSGETVSDPKDKTPEKVNNPAPEITYLGLSKLLEAGVTQYQVEVYRNTLSTFSGINNYFIKEASIDVSTITSERPEENDSYYEFVNFELLVNRQIKYNARLQLSSLSSASLILKENNKIVFDSHVVDVIEDDSYTGDGGEPVPLLKPGE